LSASQSRDRHRGLKVVSALTDVVLQPFGSYLHARCIRPGLCHVAGGLVAGFDLSALFKRVVRGVGFRVKFLGRLLQNSFVQVLSAPILHQLTRSATSLISASKRRGSLHLYDVGEDLDHLGVSEEALEELLFVLGFHLAH